MKKLILTLFIGIILISSLTAALVEMENKFIKLIGDPETGRFILKTTGRIRARLSRTGEWPPPFPF